MILTRLKAADGAPILDPDHVLGAAGDQLGIVFDDGLLAESMPPTVIQVSGNEFRVLREGALPAARLRRLTAEVITFVCTGNSCRSPMAEVLFKRMLAERLECDQNALPDRGFLVTSAGLSAALGGRASTNAQVVVRDFGASLEDHESQQLNDDLAFLSDRLVVMTAAHREQILELWPELDSRVSLLGGNEDIADPVGFPVESYRQCAAQIQRGLDRLIETVLGRKK
jgi:protein-tyrosine phosphatase